MVSFARSLDGPFSDVKELTLEAAAEDDPRRAAPRTCGHHEGKEHRAAHQPAEDAKRFSAEGEADDIRECGLSEGGRRVEDRNRPWGHRHLPTRQRR